MIEFDKMSTTNKQSIVGGHAGWLCVIVACLLASSGNAASAADGLGTSFENTSHGDVGDRTLDGLKFLTEPGSAEINTDHAFKGGQCLRLFGGDKKSVTIGFAETVKAGAVVVFQAERWTSRKPFRLIISARSSESDQWEAIHDASDGIRTGNSLGSKVEFTVPIEFSELKLESTTPEGSGLFIDDIRVYRPGPMTVSTVVANHSVHPVLIGKKLNGVSDVIVTVSGTKGNAPVVEGFRISTAGTDLLADIRSVSILLLGKPFGEKRILAPAANMEFAGQSELKPGEHVFRISYRLKETASLDRKVNGTCSEIKIDGQWVKVDVSSGNAPKRIGFALRQRGQNGVHSTRIPGLATTNAGTLIAVYDNRNRSRHDLPGDIDVGMSRSTDGGQSWEGMKVIMDMGNDPKWNHDGIGDPAILIDRERGTIWVAALWSHGDHAWRGPGRGLKPGESGQMMLVKSEDDGKTWSVPINITKQVKAPQWRFILQGPGKGISLRDGTLVFPAQYRGEISKPEKGKPYATLIHSSDHGKTWQTGTGINVDTSEAQVVELGDGSIMINSRDNRGGSRSVYTTKDLGKTWQQHSTSRTALPEPVCMASLIRIEKTREHGAWLFFSNPPQERGRHHMTIKASNDEGASWPEKWHTLVDERTSAYSCLTAVGDHHIGLLYEAPGELYFVRYPISELIEKLP